MKPVVISVLAAIMLSGCANFNQAQIPMNTTYSLDGTLAGNPAPRQRVKRQLASRSPSSSYASIETTGSIDNQDREQELYTELGKFKANTPEWLAIRKRIENDRTERSNRERDKLTICRNC